METALLKTWMPCCVNARSSPNPYPCTGRTALIRITSSEPVHLTLPDWAIAENAKLKDSYTPEEVSATTYKSLYVPYDHLLLFFTHL
jgi:hypothetical protein